MPGKQSHYKFYVTETTKLFEEETTIDGVTPKHLQKKLLPPKSIIESISVEAPAINSTLQFVNTTDEMLDEKITEPYLVSYRKYLSDFVNQSKLEPSLVKQILPEPILSLRSQRYTVFPIQYHTIWKNYKNQLKINWVVEEVDLSKDVAHWEKLLSQNDRTFIMHVLAFFAAADGLVNANIKENLIDVVKIKEAECAYGKQFEMENAHGEMYSLMLDTFVKDDVSKSKLIDSIKTMPSIKKKEIGRAHV